MADDMKASRHSPEVEQLLGEIAIAQQQIERAPPLDKEASEKIKVLLDQLQKWSSHTLSMEEEPTIAFSVTEVQSLQKQIQKVLQALEKEPSFQNYLAIFARALFQLQSYLDAFERSTLQEPETKRRITKIEESSLQRGA